MVQDPPDKRAVSNCRLRKVPQHLPRQTKRYCVQLLVEKREENQWRLLFLGKDIKVRKRAEKIAKFLLWTDNIIKKSFSTQPFAALAWLGLSILLPVRSPMFQRLHCAGIPWLLGTGTTQHEAVFDDFTSIGHL